MKEWLRIKYELSQRIVAIKDSLNIVDKASKDVQRTFVIKDSLKILDEPFSSLAKIRRKRQSLNIKCEKNDEVS